MTTKIPEKVREFFHGKMGWVATAAVDGTPNVAIKGSLRVLDDEHLLFADLFSGKTRANLEANPKVAVMVADPSSRTGYCIKGIAELVATGELYEQTVAALRQVSAQLPTPKYAVKIAVSAVFDQSLGAAGDQIA